MLRKRHYLVLRLRTMNQKIEVVARGDALQTDSIPTTTCSLIQTQICSKPDHSVICINYIHFTMLLGIEASRDKQNIILYASDCMTTVCKQTAHWRTSYAANTTISHTL